MIAVSCAIILHPDHPNQTLAVQRSADMKHPLKWELPGGKIEVGESPQSCIVREIKEELQIDIEVIESLPRSKHAYPSLTVELHPFIVRWSGGEMVLSEHAQAVFFTDNDFLSLDWLEADLPIVHHYLNNKRSSSHAN